MMTERHIYEDAGRRATLTVKIEDDLVESILVIPRRAGKRWIAKALQWGAESVEFTSREWRPYVEAVVIGKDLRYRALNMGNPSVTPGRKFFSLSFPTREQIDRARANYRQHFQKV